MYAFIKSKLANCAQLFVSTHNLEFFNLMKDFLMETKDQSGKNLYCKKDLPCYLVQQEWNKTINRSVIMDLPRELKYFKSEYVYLFSVMLDFDKEKNGADYKILYLLPNVERRFLEGYLGLRYPDGKPWTVGIVNPLNKTKAFGLLPITNGAVVTSGNYEKFVTFNNVRYSHIIDPRTGYPASKIISVTVFAPKAELADALATSIFVMGSDVGINMVDQIPNTECIIIDDEGKIYKSKNININ